MWTRGSIIPEDEGRRELLIRKLYPSELRDPPPRRQALGCMYTAPKALPSKSPSQKGSSPKKPRSCGKTIGLRTAPRARINLKSPLDGGSEMLSSE